MSATLKGNNDWRNQLSSWNDRMDYILSHKYKCDVAIRIREGEKLWDFKAHQFVLNMSSEIFENMLDKAKLTVIDPTAKMVVLALPDTSTYVFGFLYTRTVKVTTMNEAAEIYKLAEKFGITELCDICRKFAVENVTPANVLEANDFAIAYDLAKLKATCDEVLRTQTEEVLKQSRWKLEWISALLDQPNLSIEEYELFKMVESWVNTYYGDNENAKYRCHVWQTLLPKFNYLNMTPDQFMEGPLQTGGITKEEGLAVLGHIVSDEHCPVPYPQNFSKKRSQRVSTSSKGSKGSSGSKGSAGSRGSAGSKVSSGSKGSKGTVEGSRSPSRSAGSKEKEAKESPKKEEEDSVVVLVDPVDIKLDSQEIKRSSPVEEKKENWTHEFHKKDDEENLSQDSYNRLMNKTETKPEKEEKRQSTVSKVRWQKGSEESDESEGDNKKKNKAKSKPKYDEDAEEEEWDEEDELDKKGKAKKKK